jgi:hypothetical protein
MKAAIKYLVPVIPTELAVVVGEIVIRFGELERAIIMTLAQLTSQKEEDFLKEIGKHKQRNPLGILINRAEKELGKQYDWFDAQALRDLTNQRNVIHDALMQEDGWNTRVAVKFTGQKTSRR